MKVGLPFLPSSTDQPLRIALEQFFRALVAKVDGLATGQLAARDNASVAPPTTGVWARGDFVANSLPSALGTAGSRYVVTGWIRATNGSANVPGTDWLECRALTGT